MTDSSWSAVERANPPPRRKSCAACIKSKRRCSLESPACQRCVQRQINCEYPDVPTRRQRGGVATGTTATRPPSAAPSALGSVPPPDQSRPPAEAPSRPTPLPSNRRVHVIGPIFLNVPSRLPAWEENGGSPITSMLQAETISMLEPDLEAPELEPITLGSPILEPGHDPEEQLRDTDTRTSMIVSGLSGNSPAEDIISFIIASRLRYPIHRMRAAVKQMVLECATPWCHPCLYTEGMPRVLEDAISSCALYMAKTPANSHLILRSIGDRAQELFHAPIPATPIEVIARAQALLLYQIIGLFDGDVGLRDGVGAGIGSLEQVAFALMQFTTFEKGTFEPYGAQLEPAPARDKLTERCPPEAAKKFWETWVFQESARRTFIMTFFYIRGYQVITGHIDSSKETCDGKLGLCHSFTMSAHLWGARDYSNFKQAWRTKKHFAIKNADFSEVMTEGKPDDMDTFGRMLFVTAMCVGPAKSWFDTRGGNLWSV